MEGPGLTDVDLLLAKRIPILERLSLQLRAEFFNVLNHIEPEFAESDCVYGGDRRTLTDGGADYIHDHDFQADSVWREVDLLAPIGRWLRIMDCLSRI